MQADPHRSSLRSWMLIAGIACGFMLTIVGTFVFTLERGLAPPNAIVDVSELTDVQFEHLAGARLIDPNETVLMFYSSGLLSIREAGTLLTDRRVISYDQGIQGGSTWAIPYDEIADVTIVEQGNTHRPTIVAIHTPAGEQHRIALSTDGDSDRDFVDEICRRIPTDATAPMVEHDSQGR